MREPAILLASTARTATTTAKTQNSTGEQGVLLVLDVTATPNNAETLTVSIDIQDQASGKWVPITAFTALTASAIGATATTATYLYTLHPGGSETAATANHEVQSLVIAAIWRAKVTHSSTGAWTYTLGAQPLA